MKLSRQVVYIIILFSMLFWGMSFVWTKENFGVKYSTATISAVIIATIPLFVPMAAYFALSEKLKKLV